MFGAILLVSPAIVKGFDGLLPYYNEWWSILHEHNTEEIYISLIHLPPIRPFMVAHSGEVQMGSLALLSVVFFATYKRWSDFTYRTRMLAVLMGWILLFSDASENHTYIIAFSGFMMFYYTKAEHTLFDRILYWSNWFVFGVMPVDVLFPVPVYAFFRKVLWLDVCLFTVTWVYMIYQTLNKVNSEK